MSEPKKNIMSDITNELRGKASKINWVQLAFKVTLLFFSSINTVSVFDKSFAALGLFFIVFAIIFFDGGYLYWDFQRVKYASGTVQRNICELGAWASLVGVVSMIFIDFTLHSGQQYIDLNAQREMVGGWVATNGEILGAIAMLLVPAIFAIHMVCLRLFDSADVDVKHKIESREVEYQVAARELSVLRSRNTTQARLTADSIDRVGEKYEEIKDIVADQMSQSLIPDIIGEWRGQMGRTNVISATVKDVSADYQRPADTISPDDMRGLMAALNRLTAEVEELKRATPDTVDPAHALRGVSAVTGAPGSMTAKAADTNFIKPEKPA